MKHTDTEIEEAARRFEQLAGELDPESVQVEDLADLRAVAEAAASGSIRVGWLAWLRLDRGGGAWFRPGALLLRDGHLAAPGLWPGC